MSASRTASRREMPHAGGIPSTPHLRLQIVRDYAASVYGKELIASAWLGQPHEAILDGVCIVASACQTEEGFRQAMDELRRVAALRGADVDAPGYRALPAEAELLDRT